MITTMSAQPDGSSVRQRLIDAARHCFSVEDYHQVTTRRIADSAAANVSMIRYYFGSKEGLYETMIRDTLNPFFDSLEPSALYRPEGFEAFLLNYYTTMRKMPGFARLMLRVLALKQGPGYRALLSLLERGREKSRQLMQENSAAAADRPTLPPTGGAAEVARMAFISLALMPILLQGILEAQQGQPLDDCFFGELAAFNGRMLHAGLRPADPI
jgi:AcrR family transcriptional regulator